MSSALIIIGLCGRSGSGKGYVCSIFEQFGIPCIDTDRVYRELVSDAESPCLSELCECFGKGILTEDKALDRRTLAKIVFAKGNEEKLKKLNGITHKYILKRTEEIISEYEGQGFGAVVIDAPVLFESGFDKLCHITLCVSAPEDILVSRICLRDGRSESEARLRLASQKSEEELLRRCDEVIVNDGVCNIRDSVCGFIEKYKLRGKS